MESTILKKNVVHSVMSENDRKVLVNVIKLCGPLVFLEPIGRYAQMKAEDIWMALVIQVCVSGSARKIERLSSHEELFAKFKEAVSHSVVLSQVDPCAYLAERFREFSATRFHRRSAERLVKVLSSPNVFQKDRFIILDDLSHEDSFTSVRDKLMDRCPIFRLKSASDFMIVVGLSNDVIALDTRVVGIFQKYCGYNFSANQVQSKRSIYHSLEGTLRDFCQQQQISLAFLDRLLFNYGSMSIIELAANHPHLLER